MRTSVDDLDPDGLAGRQSLVDAVRELALAAGTTALGAPDLAAATRAVAEVTRLLAKESTERVVRAGFLAPRACALAGRAVRLHQLNPALPALEVAFEHDDGPQALAAALDGGDPSGLTARATLLVDALHEGPPDSVHGGTISFLMDCMLGVLVQATGVPSVTGTLDLRYLRRTPLEEPLQLRARILRRDGRKILTAGSVEHAGVRTAEASGLFVAVGQAGT